MPDKTQPDDPETGIDSKASRRTFLYTIGKFTAAVSLLAVSACKKAVAFGRWHFPFGENPVQHLIYVHDRAPGYVQSKTRFQLELIHDALHEHRPLPRFQSPTFQRYQKQPQMTRVPYGPRAYVIPMQPYRTWP